MLTAKQTKIIEGLISEFEQNNLKNQVKSEGVSLFDKAFERNQEHNLALSDWYSDIKSRNAEIKAKGEEMLCAMADKLKGLFLNYNLSVCQEPTYIYISIVLPNGLKETYNTTIFLETCVLEHNAHFDKDNLTSMDKGISIFSHCRLTHNNKSVNVDTFEGSDVFNEMIDKLFLNYGHLITKK